MVEAAPAEMAEAPVASKQKSDCRNTREGAIFRRPNGTEMSATGAAIDSSGIINSIAAKQMVVLQISPWHSIREEPRSGKKFGNFKWL